MTQFLLILAAWLAYTLWAVATPLLSLKVIDKVGLAPLSVRFKVRVPRDAHNRLLTLTLDGPLDYQRQDIEINGEDAAITYDRTWEVRNGGPMVFSARILRDDGRSEILHEDHCYPGRVEQASCAEPSSEVAP